MWVPEMNTIVWGRNITLEEDDVVYEKVSQFENNEEGLGRLILTDPDKIKSLVASINHNMKKGSFTNNNNTTVNLPKQQEERHLDSTVNNLVDQFGDTGIEEGEFPQARDNNYIPATDQSQPQPRSHPQRVRKPSQRVLDNVIHYNEIPVDDLEVFVNNTFVIMYNEPVTYTQAMQRPDNKKWHTAMDKEDKSL
jgi:hypothetical protein